MEVELSVLETMLRGTTRQIEECDRRSKALECELKGCRTRLDQLEIDIEVTRRVRDLLEIEQEAQLTALEIYKNEPDV